jgi:hypothetical protein
MEYLEYIYKIDYYRYIISPIVSLFDKKINYNIENIKDTIDKMTKIKLNIESKNEFINKKINIYENNARNFYKNKKKNLAINNLKLKKIYENEKNKLDSIIFNIETYIFQIDSMGLMLETAETLKTTSIQITSLNKKLNISNIEDILEVLNDNKEISNELQNIFTDNASINIEYDEDELLNELEDLNNEPTTIIEDKFPKVPTTIIEDKFPAVPTTIIEDNPQSNTKKIDTILN